MNSSVAFTPAFAWPVAFPPLNLATLDAAGHLLAYVYYFRFSWSRNISQYSKRANPGSNQSLVWFHVACGAIAPVRFYIASMYGPVKPDLLDFVLAVMLGIGSFNMARTLTQGDPLITRAIYQTESIVCVGLSAAGLVSGSSNLHSASIHFTDNFLYTRLAIHTLLRLRVFPKFKDLYTTAALASPLLAAADTGIPYAGVGFCALLYANIQLHRWTATQIRESSGSAYRNNILVRFLTDLGMVELDCLKMVKDEKGSEESEKPKDS